jgi:hypothetical protein
MQRALSFGRASSRRSGTGAGYPAAGDKGAPAAAAESQPKTKQRSLSFGRRPARQPAAAAPDKVDDAAQRKKFEDILWNAPTYEPNVPAPKPPSPPAAAAALKQRSLSFGRRPRRPPAAAPDADAVGESAAAEAAADAAAPQRTVVVASVSRALSFGRRAVSFGRRPKSSHTVAQPGDVVQHDVDPKPMPPEVARSSSEADAPKRPSVVAREMRMPCTECSAVLGTHHPAYTTPLRLLRLLL